MEITFANQPSFDYGDLPDSDEPYGYTTLAENDGAVHGILSDFHLGEAIDGELDGQPHVNATGDDVTGVPNDDDGIVFTSGLFPGSFATIQATVTHGDHSPGVLQGWIDFDRDGEFSTAGEQIVFNRELQEGSSPLSFYVPRWAATNNSYARFRYGFEYGISFNGPALAGEVEDYLVPIGTDPASGFPDRRRRRRHLKGI